MARSGELARLKGWPLVVIFGFGLFSAAGFIWAAAQKKSKRWTTVAICTSGLTVFGWILMGSWQHDGKASDGATAFVLEMWLAFVALAWIISKDYSAAALATAGTISDQKFPGTASETSLHDSMPTGEQNFTPPPSRAHTKSPRPHQRTPLTCPVTSGRAIGSYSNRDIDLVFDWIASDGIHRSRDAFLAEFVATMGHRRRDPRIVAVFDDAYGNFLRRNGH